MGRIESIYRENKTLLYIFLFCFYRNHFTKISCRIETYLECWSTLKGSCLSTQEFQCWSTTIFYCQIYEINVKKENVELKWILSVDIHKKEVVYQHQNFSVDQQPYFCAKFTKSITRSKM